MINHKPNKGLIKLNFQLKSVLISDNAFQKYWCLKIDLPENFDTAFLVWKIWLSSKLNELVRKIIQLLRIAITLSLRVVPFLSIVIGKK